MKLLRSFLRAPIRIKGKLQKRRKCVPQGSLLSPLLSNILLNELDKELDKRGHRYVRYVDDFSIYVRSKKSAKRVGDSIYKFLRDKLQLPINRQKSGIIRPLTFSVLGYSFVPTYKKGEKGKYLLVVKIVVKKSKWAVLKSKLKQLSKKTIPMSFDERIRRINWLIRVVLFTIYIFFWNYISICRSNNSCFIGMTYNSLALHPYQINTK